MVMTKRVEVERDLATLSPEEIAQILGTSPWWVREQARRGRVPHLRLGRQRIRFLPEQVDVILTLSTVGPVEEPTESSSEEKVEPQLSALGSTARSVAAHRRRPHTAGEPPSN
ncbi:MAG: helix-turn-helix domain-containing protein [Actinomycetes bacterium]